MQNMLRPLIDKRLSSCKVIPKIKPMAMSSLRQWLPTIISALFADILGITADEEYNCWYKGHCADHRHYDKISAESKRVAFSAETLRGIPDNSNKEALALFATQIHALENYDGFSLNAILGKLEWHIRL